MKTLNEEGAGNCKWTEVHRVGAKERGGNDRRHASLVLCPEDRLRILDGCLRAREGFQARDDMTLFLIFPISHIPLSFGGQCGLETLGKIGYRKKTQDSESTTLCKWEVSLASVCELETYSL